MLVFKYGPAFIWKYQNIRHIGFSLVHWSFRVEADILNGLINSSPVNTFQVRSLSELRLVERIVRLDEETMKWIGTALLTSLNLNTWLNNIQLYPGKIMYSIR